MAKKGTGEKEQYWRSVLKRQSRSGLSIAKFCRSEGISEPSFYWWKRRLRAGSKRNGKSPKRSGNHSTGGRAFETSASFVPVQIAADDPGAAIRVTWPGGLVAQVPIGCDPSEVEAALRVVDGLGREERGG